MIYIAFWVCLSTRINCLIFDWQAGGTWRGSADDCSQSLGGPFSEEVSELGAALVVSQTVLAGKSDMRSLLLRLIRLCAVTVTLLK